MNDVFLRLRPAALASFGLLALTLAACSDDEPGQTGGQAPPPPTVTVAKPLVREIIEDDEFVGRFEAIDEVEVRARVAGYLEGVHFTDGGLIKAGDLLFTIDQRPFKLAVEEARSQLQIARTQVDFAKAQLDRAEELAARGNIAVATLDERRQTFLAAQAQTEGAKAALQRAELDMEYTRVTAPIGGRIDRNFVSPGNLVQADQTVLTRIVTLNPIEFYFDIDERSLLAYSRDARTRGGSVQEGAGSLPVTVRIADNTQQPFTGVLDFAENRVDEQSGTLRVRARLDNPDLILQPGLFGRINVPGSLPYRGVLVPDEAVASDQNRRVVYVLGDDNIATVRPVRPGPKLFGYRVIREGLSGDETIIVNGLIRVRPGALVTPEMTELPPEREEG